MTVPVETVEAEAQTTDELWAALADSARKVTSQLRSKTLDNFKSKDSEPGRLTTLEATTTKDLGEMRRNAYQGHDTLSKGSKDLAKAAVASFRSPTGRERAVAPMADK